MGESKIIGSYFPSEYPHLSDRLRKDLKSFLFVSGKQNDAMHFFKFEAID